MAMFSVSAEHVPARAIKDIREFAKKNKIRLTRIDMDEMFTNVVRIRVSGDTKRVANKVRDFIWNEINGGAWCDVKAIKKG